MSYREQGFSLLELVVALAIGAMIVLMTVSLYASSLHRATDMHNTATVMDKEIHGIAAMSEQLRLAGLGMMDSWPQAVLINAGQLAALTDGSGSPISPKQLTQAAYTPATIKNLPASDQLTVQYTAPADMWDCEGNLALGRRRVRLTDGTLAWVDGQVIIERYFVQREDDGTTALRCDAARYITDAIERDGTRDRRGGSIYINAIIDERVNDNKADRTDKRLNISKSYQLRGGGGLGVVLVPNIDGFWVRLTVADRDKIYQLPIDQYQNQPIVGVSLLVLNRAAFAINHSQKIQDSIKIFGQAFTLPKDNLPRQLNQIDVAFVNVMNTNAINASANTANLGNPTDEQVGQP
ncbi:PilW family protein [Moraxella sp. ZJ142]|uniref:PilW family protein n=1 Tax=Moraxella marmotae TaxID=3344520 RepID=UPI0035D4410F